MKEWYPYRFKTIVEFENEFGNNWRNDVYLQFPYFMNILLGTQYPYNIDIKDKRRHRELHNYMGYHISWDMLIENKKIEPNYKPRKIEKTI